MIQPISESDFVPNRTGSPFAVGTATPKVVLIPELMPPEPIGEGVWRETAAAGAVSAWMLVFFVIAGWFWFPAGGVVIAGLGIAMSMFGLSSRMLKWSIAAAVIHVAMLVACYLK